MWFSAFEVLLTVKRWIFWLNLPLCGVSAVLVALFVKGVDTPGSLLTRLGMIDWPGMLLFAAGLTTFLIGISWVCITNP
jgi:hypothetical protein